MKVRFPSFSPDLFQLLGNVSGVAICCAVKHMKSCRKKELQEIECYAVRSAEPVDSGLARYNVPAGTFIWGSATVPNCRNPIDKCTSRAVEMQNQENVVRTWIKHNKQLKIHHTTKVAQIVCYLFGNSTMENDEHGLTASALTGANISTNSSPIEHSIHR